MTSCFTGLPERHFAARRSLWIATFLGCLVFLLGLPGHAVSQSVRVGVLLPLSGHLAAIGDMEKTAFSMAALAVNDQGGIHGHRLDLLFADTAGKPSTARSAAERLISQEAVVALSGGVSSAVAWEIANLAQQKRIPFLVTTASANRITEKGLDHVFRLAAPAGEQFDPLTSFVRRATDIHSAGILWDQDMGDFLYRRFLRLFRHVAVRVNMREPYRSGDTDPMDVILEAMVRNPHLICVIARAKTGAMLIQQAREAGLNPRAFLGGTTDFATDAFAAAADESAEHVFAVTPWVQTAPYPRARDFYQAFSKTFGAPPHYHAAQAFAAAEVIVDALRRSPGLASEEIQQALAATDMMTVFGPVRFIAYEHKTQQNRAPAFLIQWQRGEPQIVWPRNMATAPYVYPLPIWSAQEDSAGAPARQTGDRLRLGDQ
jgi:branched-chain amino acid transport system substrate-binding protein